MSIRPPAARLRAAAISAAVVGALALGSAPASAAGPSALRDLAAPSGLRIGTAINTDQLGANAEYDRIAAKQFSSVTPENVMKWGVVEPTRGTYDWSGADELVRFAERHDQDVRGHTLVWYNQLPTWLQGDAGAALSKAEARKILKKHIFDEMGRYKGRIWQWDVVNEAFDDTEQAALRKFVFPDKLGSDYIAQSFRWAHQADPKAQLFYNDYNIEYAGPKQDAVYDLVKRLLKQGVPIDGVGFQTHLATQYGTPDIKTSMKRFTKLGLKVALTEVDVRTKLPVTPEKLDAQRAGYSETLQACLAVKQCLAYTVWGFGDEYSWIPGVFEGEGAADIYDEDLKPKPQYRTLQQVLRTANGVPVRNR